MKYTREFLAPYVAASISISEVCRALGIRQQGGTASYVSKRVRELGLDTAHFLGARANTHPKHRASFHRKSADEILVVRTPGSGKETTHRLVRALKEMGREYVCTECGQGDEWNGRPLTIQVDHINGDPMNNLQENLRFLCPNCHTQTPTFILGQRTPKERKCRSRDVKVYQDKYCSVCPTKIHKDATHCRSCAAKIREAASTRERPTKIDWPSDDELRAQVAASSHLAVGRALGVSDNAIRKRLRRG